MLVTLCTTEKTGKWNFLGPLTLKIKQTPHNLASYQFWVSSHIKYVHKWFICLKTWIHPKFCLYTWFTDNSNGFGSKYSLQCSTCFHYRLLFVYFYTCCSLFFIYSSFNWSPDAEFEFPFKIYQEVISGVFVFSEYYSFTQ